MIIIEFRPPLSKELWFSEDPEVAKKLVFKDVSLFLLHLIFIPFYYSYIVKITKYTYIYSSGKELSASMYETF